MCLKKLILTIGVCTVSFLSNSAIADQHEWWAVNCKTNKCLQATEKGLVTVSDCKLGLASQEWEVTDNLEGSPTDRENRTSGFIRSFVDPDVKNCLTIQSHDQVTTRSCLEKPQEWVFPPLRGRENVPGIRVNQIKIGNRCLAVEKSQLSIVYCAITDCDKGDQGVASQCWFWVNVGNACPSCSK